MKIELNNLTKTYRKKRVVNNINLQIDEPNIYALLGRNGAGKTTLMEIIAGHQLPTEGTIRINGIPPFDQRTILQHLCLVKESKNFHRDLKVKDILHTYANLYDTWNAPLAEELLDTYALPVNARIKTLSKGMESALSILVGLASGAKLTLFDEPYIGMDAAARQHFYDTLRDVQEKEKRTIILSTHLIDEASRLFHKIFLIDDGTLTLAEEVETIREKAYAVTGNKTDVTNFIQHKHVLHTKQIANTMVAYLYDDQTDIPEPLQVEGIPLQDVILYMTKKEETTNDKRH